MAKLDYRLREFFKKVDKSAAEVRNKKTGNATVETPAEATTAVQVVESKANIKTSAVASTSPESSTANVRSAVNNTATAVAERPRAATSKEAPKHIHPKPAKLTNQATTIVEQDKVEGKLLLTTEGTGEPRPMGTNGLPIPRPKARNIEELLEDPEPKERKHAKVEPKSVVELESGARETDSDSLSTQEKWSRIPHHLQVLFSSPDSEVAQRSYKAFRDTRAQLIERLLDPPLTLEETARILNVCPTTVRRYTDSDKLKHYRTAGNQRRFRLSDILGFMESNDKSDKKHQSKRKQFGEE